MSNKTIGNNFEVELAEILSQNGYWVHLLNANRSGQPADVIAVINNQAYLIDAKVCSNNDFPLSRIEENQRLAMELWEECGNDSGWFALKLDKFNPQIYMISYYLMSAFSQTRSTLSTEMIKEFGMPIDKWVERCK